MTVSIGDDVVDGYKPTVSWYMQGVKWLTSLEEFYRERAAIEREAALKLASLVSKHFSKKAAASAQVSVGEDPATTPGSLENSSLKAWAEVLKQTEQMSFERKQLADQLNVVGADQIAGIVNRFEGLKSRISECNDAFIEDRDEKYSLVKKAKSSYDSVCEDMEHARSKGKKTEKREVEMANQKNAYILSVNVANRVKDKYFHDDLPQLLDLVQKFYESRTGQLNRILKATIDAEKAQMASCTAVLDIAREQVNANKPDLDVSMFIRHNMRAWKDPEDFIFQPSPVWHEDEALNTSDAGLRHLRGRLEAADKDVAQATSKSENMLTLFEDAQRACNVNLEKVTATKLAPLLKAYAASLKALVRQETKRITHEVEIEAIEAGTASKDMSSVPLTRTKTTRGIFGKRKEVVEVIDASGKPVRSKNSLGIKSLLARSVGKSRNDIKGPAALVNYDFEAGGPGEITVRAGEALMLITDDDGSGWIKVSRPNEEPGLIPASYAEISIPESRGAAPEPPPSRPTGNNTVTALYDYQAQAPDQLSIRTGNRITVLEPDTGTGWTKGSLDGVQGLFPTSYAS